MNAFTRISRILSRIPPKWRSKLIPWLATAVASRLVILVWGAGTLLVGLILLSFAGFMLKEYGVTRARHLESFLGNVWDYFRGVILAALLMAVWPAVKSIFSGDVTYGLVHVLVILFIAAVVFEQFKATPRSWSTLSRGPSRRRLKPAGRRSTQRRRKAVVRPSRGRTPGTSSASKRRS